MKLCIDARMLQASGIGTYLQNLLPVLSNRFSLILIGDSLSLKPYQAQSIHSDISIYSIRELLQLPSLIPECDIFWSPHYNVPILPINAKKRLVTIHDVYHLAYFHTLSLKQKIYAKIIMQAAVRLSNHIITVSEFSKQEITRFTGIDKNKISVIYNGVNHDQFRIIQDKSLKQRVVQKYKLPTKFLLYVGNVKPHKNLISLIKAFDHIKNDIHEYNLVIVGKKDGFITGDNSLFSTIDSNNELKKRIHFTGFVEDIDLPLIYNLASLFVFPSLYEGFGLPPLEAMACGCPVLVSDQACMPEICGPDILYVRPNVTDQLGAMIKKALSFSTEQQNTYLEKGLSKSAQFTWYQSIESHVELINNL